MKRALPRTLFLWSIVAATPLAAEATREVNINVRLTDEGRKLVPPSRARPVFYTPVVAGYASEGPNLGDAPPVPKVIVEAWVMALAKQGYLISIPKKTPPASLILIFKWGVINRQIEEVPVIGAGDTQTVPVIRNQPALLKLLGGADADFLWAGVENDWLMSELQSDRCFVMVAAYDYAAAERQKKTLLWIARMSAATDTIPLDDMLPKLIAAGAPYVGRETKRPQRIDLSEQPQGTVEVGTPVVVPETAGKK